MPLGLSLTLVLIISLVGGFTRKIGRYGYGMCILGGFLAVMLLLLVTGHLSANHHPPSAHSLKETLTCVSTFSRRLSSLSYCR